MHIKNWAMAIELTQDHWKKVVRYIRATPMIELSKKSSGYFCIAALHSDCYLCEYAERVKQKLNRTDCQCIFCPVYQTTNVNCFHYTSVFNDFFVAKTKKALLAAAITIRDFELTTQGIE